ncbi:MAG: hypothetical protein WCG85_25015, partial [Polyangia bacterium]
TLRPTPPCPFSLAPLHRQFATAETACLTLLGAVRDGSNQLRTREDESASTTPTTSESASYAAVQGVQEYRLRYVCKGAPAGYEPPPMDLGAINETVPSKPASINVNMK